VTKGKYGTLINALLHFKEDYDAQRAAERSADRPARRVRLSAYAGMGLT